MTLDGVVYGKPADRAGAARMLRALSGRTHEVVSGLVLLDGDSERERSVHAVTEVSFRELDEPLLEWYLGFGQWRERSGSYAIQGAAAALVREVRGDYENIVGLPLAGLLDIAPSCSRARPRRLPKAEKSLQKGAHRGRRSAAVR